MPHYGQKNGNIGRDSTIIIAVFHFALTIDALHYILLKQQQMKSMFIFICLLNYSFRRSVQTHAMGFRVGSGGRLLDSL